MLRVMLLYISLTWIEWIQHHIGCLGSFSVRNTQYFLLDVKSDESITETAAVVGCAASRTQCILPTLMGVNSHVPPRPVLCDLSLSSKLGVFNFVHFVRQFVPNFLSFA